jgi:hypothetical protein
MTSAGFEKSSCAGVRPPCRRTSTSLAVPRIAQQRSGAHPEGGAHVLKETPGAIAQLSNVLRKQGAAAAPKIIARLKARYPEASNAEISNYLITAYCPVVETTPGLTEAAKSLRMRRFSRQVESRLF